MKNHITDMREAGYEEQTFQYVPQLLKLDAACCPRESFFVCCASRPK
uniref:Uncharacterized protein n=1 Tax=Globodera pallida TaxID=36090 RepID=A0A183CR19_GLOPA